MTTDNLVLNDIYRWKCQMEEELNKISEAEKALADQKAHLEKSKETAHQKIAEATALLDSQGFVPPVVEEVEETVNASTS